MYHLAEVQYKVKSYNTEFECHIVRGIIYASLVPQHTINRVNHLQSGLKNIS